MTGQSGGGQSALPFLYLPVGWDTTWRAAKGAAGATPAQILFLGDSNQAGVLASDWKKSYVHVLRESLKVSLGRLHADYFPAFGLSAIPEANVPGTPPWSVFNALGSATTHQTAFSWHNVVYNNTAGPSTYYHQTFTSIDTCTALDLFYVDEQSGTWVYSIDGGADQTVTCTNGAVQNTCQTKKISITGLANTTHTVAVGKQSASFVCIPVGVATYPTGLTGGGLSIARFTSGFQTVADYVTGTQNPGNRPEHLAGITPQNGTGTGTSFGYPTQPHLTVVQLGVNDCSLGTTIANFETGLRRFIQAIRKGRSNASIVLHIVCNPDTEISDVTSGFVPANWPGFMASYFKFAQAYNCAILNSHAKWGESPAAQGLLTQANNVHPTDAGHQDIANDLLSIL